MHQFWQDMKGGGLKPVYLFYGTEPYLMAEALGALRLRFSPDGESWNIDVLDGETTALTEVILSAGTYSFFGGDRLVMVKNAPWFAPRKKRADLSNDDEAEDEEQGSSSLEPLLEYLDAPMQGVTVVFVSEAPPDKRRAPIKKLAKVGRLTEFAQIKDSQLSLWIRQRFIDSGRDAHFDVVNLLIMSCGNNLYLLANEIEKILTYIGEKKTVAVDDCLPVISVSSTRSVFELIDLISARKGREAVGLYNEMTGRGEAAQKILVLIARQFHNMLAAQNMNRLGLPRTQMMSELNIGYGFILDKLLGYARFFTPTQLMKILEILLHVDLANKTGQGSMDVTMETAILHICVVK